jgi:hypothetical protein
MSPMTNKTEGEGLKPFFCRQGNKYRVIDLILSKILRQLNTSLSYTKHLDLSSNL